MGLTIAIIGRPNVGKSTLFNRLVGQKLALVDDTPGVTRDRRQHPASLQDLQFSVIDTAGLEEADSASLAGRMRAQTEQAIHQADLVLFVIDARAGLLPSDREFAHFLRKLGKKVVLIANKAEGKAAQAGLDEAWELGFGMPCAFSAEHGLGLSDLRDAIIAAVGEKQAFSHMQEEEVEFELIEASIGDDLEDEDEDDEEEAPYDVSKPLKIAIVGRPNVGKSTLINKMIGEERLLTGPEAGITRDSIALDWRWGEREIALHDTAGLRRKARVQEKLEKLSVGETLRAIRFAEVVVIVFDALQPFERQDLQIADLVIREGRAPIIAFNKWDLVEDRQETLERLHEACTRLLPQVRGLRAVPVSAATGQGIERLMENIELVHRIWNRRVPTARLNRWLAEVVAQHPPPSVSGRRLKLKYMTQIKTRPPGFVLACSRPEALPQSYLRYLINGLRTYFDMPSVPVRLSLRSSDNPFAGRAKKR